MKNQISSFVASMYIAFFIPLLVMSCSPSSDSSPTTVTPVPTIAPTALPPDAGWACSSAPTDAWGGSGMGDPYDPFWGNGGYIVQHYEIELEVDIDANQVQGQTTISAKTTQDLDAFNLDFLGMEISSLLINGIDADFCRDDSGELTIILPDLLSEGESFITSVSYYGTPIAFDYPGQKSYGWVKAEEGVFTSGPPLGPAYLYPNNDFFKELATYTVILTVPEGYHASTTGSLDETIQYNGQVTTLWNLNVPAPFIVFSIDKDSTIMTLEGPEGLPIRFQYPTSLTYWFEETIEDAPEFIEFFSSIYGPFPYDLIGITVVNRHGIFVSTPTLVFISSADPQIKLAHELTHQWFPHSLAAYSQEMIWLNEGIASYAEILWLEHKGQSADDLIREIYWGLPDKTHPPGYVTPEQQMTEEVWEVVYERPQVAFHALRLRVGDEAFFTIYKTFAERFKGSRKVNSSDFISVAEEVSGQDLESFFDTWLYQEAVPEIPELGLSKNED